MALAPQDRDTFEAIRSAPGIALLDTTYDGRPAASIVRVTRVGDDCIVEPLAVLLTPAMLDRVAMDGQAPTAQAPA